MPRAYVKKKCKPSYKPTNVKAACEAVCSHCTSYWQAAKTFIVDRGVIYHRIKGMLQTPVEKVDSGRTPALSEDVENDLEQDINLSTYRRIAETGRENISVHCCVAASGALLPPHVIYKAKGAVQPRWPYMEKEYSGTLYSATDKEYTEESVFFHWLTEFCKQSANHSVVTPKSSYASHAATKQMRLWAINSWMGEDSSEPQSTYPSYSTQYNGLENIYWFACKCVERIYHTKQIISGFRETACYPIDADIFSKEDFDQMQFKRYHKRNTENLQYAGQENGKD
ncbi:hypothetical protein PR048_031573 [Dryococelus australis]|uniref:DDE-1 domain-containing protein n=1 Tax=Dryococelus australis TaxID=614101 RepID=A0ABQ9G5N4_9NEOP|nr:hypothetical protein PR048_031573 [Dryococelus australis]